MAACFVATRTRLPACQARLEDGVLVRSPLGRRRLLLYVATIAIPTLILLALGLQSMARQRLALETLERANRGLQADRLAAEIEARLGRAAAAALRDPEFDGLDQAIGAPLSGGRRRVAQIAAGIVRRHPVARQVFVIDAGTVRWPALRAPLPATSESMSGDDRSPGTRRYWSRFAEAEALELRAAAPRQAAAIYRDLSTRSVPPVLKALALSRVARSELQSGRSVEALLAWRELADLYGDLEDRYHQPYGLLVPLAIADAKAPEAAARDELQRAYDSLVEGRWPVSAEQADYFLGALEDRLGTSSDSRPRTRFLEAFEVARALEQSFSGRTDADNPGEVPGTAGRDRRYHLYYAAGRAPARQLGFVIDTDWVRRDLLPRTQDDLQVGGVATLQPAQPPSGPDTPTARAPFRNVLTSWELVLGNDAPGDPALSPPFLTFAGVTLLVVLVLGLGVVLLLRDVARESQLNQLRGAFVSGVSHDLKTPLTLVRLHAESLADDQEPPAEERRAFYDVILRETERLTRMIDRALSFSKSEAGTRLYTMTEGSIVDVVAATLEQYGPYLRRRGVQWRVELDEPVPDSRFDADAVTEALVNLLDNASKYSGSSGRILVRAAGRDGRAVIEVVDRGIGIAPDDQARIFQRFYRIDRNDGQGGYGLGLFLVKDIMDAHHGTIEVESELGRGSLFRLGFPAVTPPSSRHQAH